jgi:hypothetical protein
MAGHAAGRSSLIGHEPGRSRIVEKIGLNQLRASAKRTVRRASGFVIARHLTEI